MVLAVSQGVYIGGALWEMSMSWLRFAGRRC
jgi:hypothetical protein